MPHKALHYAAAAGAMSIPRQGKLQEVFNLQSFNMKKKTSGKLALTKIKIASLSKARQEAAKGGMATTSSIKISCISTTAQLCSDDSCIF